MTDRAALALAVAMFLIAAAVPLLDPQRGRVAERAYGPTPLGLPWPMLHVPLAWLGSLPQPAFQRTLLLVQDRARTAGIALTGPVCWVGLACGLPAGWAPLPKRAGRSAPSWSSVSATCSPYWAGLFIEKCSACECVVA